MDRKKDPLPKRSRANFTQDQRLSLAMLGRAIELIPHRVKALLEKHQVRTPRLPSATALSDLVVGLLSRSQPKFQDELATLLVHFDRFETKKMAENHFDPSIIAAAASTVSSSIGSIFSSKNERQSVEAASKAQIETSRINARANFMSRMMTANGVQGQAAIAKSKSAQKGKNLTTIAIGTVTLFLIGFGAWYLKSQHSPKFQV
jgi:hypothetical protein